MKRKNFDKKLKLSKETIVHLDKMEIENVYGGAHELTPRCVTLSGVPCRAC